MWQGDETSTMSNRFGLYWPELNKAESLVLTAKTPEEIAEEALKKKQEDEERERERQGEESRLRQHLRRLDLPPPLSR